MDNTRSRPLLSTWRSKVELPEAGEPNMKKSIELRWVAE
jgi:hypothetical protein